MDDQAAITDATVRTLAEVAGLPLAADRRAALAPQLEVWVNLANELSRTMSSPSHSPLPPVTVFSHGAGRGGR